MKIDKLFGIAAIIFSSGYFLRSMPFAQAYQGPAVGMGSVPYESFTGSLSSNITATLFTVPADKVFVVTTCITNSSHFYLKEDGNDVLMGASQACGGDSYGTTTSFRTGNAHLIINGGSALEIWQNSGQTRNYYIEGYYAQP